MIRDARSTRLAPAALAFPVSICFCLPLAAGEAVHCVQTPGQLQAALSVAAQSPEDDDIRLRSGHYLHNLALEYHGQHADTLRISGGWSGDAGNPCEAQTLDGRATRLDGGGDHQILRLQSHVHAPATQGPRFEVANLHFDNGFAQGFVYGGGLQMQAMSSLPTTFHIDNVIFSGNRALHGGALDISLASGSVRVANSLFHDNSAPDRDFGQFSASLGHLGVDMLIANSTFARGQCGGAQARGCGVGAIIAAGSQLRIVNSLFWQNAMNDVYLQGMSGLGQGSAGIDHSLAAVAGDIPPSLVAPLAGDPLFVDPATDDFALADTSPFIDQGLAALPSPLPPAHDLHGNPRLRFAGIDPGALENQGADPIFVDGFQ